MGKIFYLLGKSASGKDSIYRGLLERNPGLKSVVLYTTRPMRSGEIPGKTYNFITQDEYEKKKKNEELIEYREYSTMQGIWAYMTANDGQVDLSRGSYLMIGTLDSYRKTRDFFGEKNVVPVYLTVDDGERLSRALKREMQQKKPLYAEMCRRFLADEEDFSGCNLRECGINREFRNDDYEKCLEDILALIEEENI